MKTYLIALLIGATLAAGAFFAFGSSSQRTPLQVEQERIAIQHAEATAPAYVIASWIVIVGFPAALLLGAVAGGAVLLNRFRRLARPDAAGRLPVMLSEASGYQSAAVAALTDYHRTERQRASIAPVPHTIHTTHNPTFAPRMAYEYEHNGSAGELAGEPVLSLAAGLVPTFAQLLDQGRIGYGRPLLLGVDQQTGDEVEGSWLDLYSTIVSGLPGSGKTTSQRFLACQTALSGARFVIVDPHAGASDQSLAATLAPLSRAFLCAPASDDKAILAAVQLVADIGKRRINGQDTSTYPVILWLDETTSLLSRSTVAGPLATLVEAIAQEYRKKSVFACASGQIWSASRTGDDSALRDSFASVICHRMKRSQARLLVPTDEAQRVERLGTGQALLWRTSGETTVIGVPNTTAHDVQRVAGLLTNDAPTVERLTPQSPIATDQPLISQLLSQDIVENQPEPQSHTRSDYSASQRAPLLAPEEARIVSLFLDGKDAGAIVTEITGGWTSKKGTPYMVKLSEVQATIRKALAARQVPA